MIALTPRGRTDSIYILHSEKNRVIEASWPISGVVGTLHLHPDNAWYNKGDWLLLPVVSTSFVGVTYHYFSARNK